MSEREKEILESINQALPHMSEFEKGYMLGVAENTAKQKKLWQQEQEQEQKAG